MNNTFISEFSNPSSRFRGKPFWSWNSRLDPHELKTQIRQLHTMGFGGFFMHARVGLDTAYLSTDWFACVDACIEEAKKLGMEAWLYDEDRFPSGAAGGMVTKNPEYRARRLKIQLHDTLPETIPDDGLLALFTGVFKNGAISGLKMVHKPVVLDKGNTLLVFRRIVLETSDWFNGGSYLDTLNHAAVRCFIDTTHEQYRRNIGASFGTVVPGIFTDEPNFNDMGWFDDTPTSLFPWTDRLPEVFKRRYGYDPVERLPEIFFTVEGEAFSRARHHYHDCVTHLFVDAYSRQIGEWCGRNNLLFTGHVLGEEMLSNQAGVVGSAMRFYEHMQAPGMDLLTVHNREYDTAKCVASVARQLGRQWRITETYGCTGWDFPWLGHKALGDWQVALGINVRSHHLAHYTMESEAKRDYPGSISYQAPWWEQYRYVEDYFSRINVVMTRGEEVRDILVVHPIESMWQNIRYGWNQERVAIREIDRRFIHVRDALLGANLDFDYGDEEMLSRLATVACGNGSTVLIVGQARYRTVILPQMSTMRPSTLALLEKFRSAGGVVIFAHAAATHLDAVASEKVGVFSKQCISCNGDHELLVKATASASRIISITDGKRKEIAGLLHLLREDCDAYYLFVCNTSHEFTTHDMYPVGDDALDKRTISHPVVRIRGFAGCMGAPVLVHPETGLFSAAEATNGPGGWEIRTSFARLGSRLFIVPKKSLIFPLIKIARRPVVLSKKRILRTRWDVRLSESNVCVLDRPMCAIGNAEAAGPDEVLRVDCDVRRKLGIALQGGSMIQPWARTKNPDPPSTPVTLVYPFTVDHIPSGDLLLGIERPDLYTIHLNGTLVDTARPLGYWVDRSLRTVRLDSALLRKGENRLVVACGYNENHPGFEIIYLLGTFGVRVVRSAVTLTKWDNTLVIGDWTRQGLPFFSGAVTYATAIVPSGGKTRTIVRVPAFKGSLVRVFVDGKPAGIIAWEPNELDITGFIGKTKYTLGIQVISHRRNSHGPLHLADSQPGWTGPAEFRTKNEKWTDGYTLVECGLMAAPEVVEIKG